MAGMIIASAIFCVSYLFIVWNRFSVSIITMLGAFLTVAFGILTQEEAVRAVDFNTIGLLCGMMMIVHMLRLTGIFEYAAIKAIKLSSGRPAPLLLSLCTVTAALSALLDNVTTVLIVVPITFAVTDALRIKVTPFLIGEIVFANLGGTATLIGDPPNILIGARAGLTFTDFLWNDAPIVLLLCVVVAVLLLVLYRKELVSHARSAEILQRFDESRAITDRRLLTRALAVFGFVLLGFLTHALHHVDLAAVALGGAFLLLLITGYRPEQVLREVEWATLFFFIGLFVLVGGLQKTGVITLVSRGILVATEGSPKLLALSLVGVSALSASLLSAVPYTATMIPVIELLGAGGAVDIAPLWWALSLGACLGANGTIVGSAANMVVVNSAAKNKVEIGFGDYARVGMPIVAVTASLATLYVYLRYL